MRVILSVLRELVALFVDDGSLAASALVWVAVCGLVAPRLEVPSLWLGVALGVGLAVILVENALRGAGRAARKS